MIHYTSALSILAILLSLSGCGGETTTDAGPQLDAAGHDASATDAGHDAGVDAAADDGGRVERDAGCVGESDARLCEAAGADCGALMVSDRCGASRTPDCGACVSPEACGIDEPNQCANADWVVTRIDDGGERIDLTIDGSDALHVAFRKDRELWYAVMADGAWTTERVDDPILGGDVAIAIDGSGGVHIATPLGSTTPSRAIDLWARDGGGAWTQTLIDGVSVTSVDLTFDGDAAQLCGYHPNSGGFGGFLTHFAEGPSGFTSVTVDGRVGSRESREGNYCSLAFDGADLHVAYHGGQFQRLEYAAESGGAWTVETVDSPSGDFAGEYVSLALDGAGEPVISYRALTIGDPEIRLARRDGAGWRVSTVDGGAGVIANHTSLALDASGGAHISYFDSDAPGTMRYARQTASGFELHDVAVVGTGSGGFNAIGLDSTGRAHIVYYDAARGALMHATPR